MKNLAVASAILLGFALTPAVAKGIDPRVSDSQVVTLKKTDDSGGGSVDGQ